MPQLSPRDQEAVPAATAGNRPAVVKRVAEAKQRLAAWTTTTNRVAAEPAPEPKTMADHRADGFLPNFSLVGCGLEIGPSHNPIAPKSAGHDVAILDHLPQAGLRKKYADHGVDLEAIEPVDFVWKGQPYPELVGEQRFDWIIASHVIEHVPDLVNFVNECLAILRPGGTLALIVPDMRFCFDALRSPTSLSELVDSHLLERKAPSPGQVADFYLNLAKRGERTSWHVGEAGAWGREGNRADALRFTDQAIAGRVHDVHVWRFTPSSFRLHVAQLATLGLLSAHEAFFQTSSIGEFYVGLTHAGSHEPRTEADLLQLALDARTELGQHVGPLPAPTAQQ